MTSTTPAWATPAPPSSPPFSPSEKSLDRPALRSWKPSSSASSSNANLAWPSATPTTPRGWHATATTGTMAAAAACAKLLGLGPDNIGMALGIAASSSAGMRINFGTMTKPFHVGQAARAGMMAALLASNGFTASADILDHPIDYTRVFADKDEADSSRIVGTLGNPWDIVSPGLVVKKFPCCNSTHRTIDATLALATKHTPSPDSIDNVVISMPPGEDIPLIYSRATTGLEGKFCMQYCVASAILDRKVTLDTFQQDHVDRPGGAAPLRPGQARIR